MVLYQTFYIKSETIINENNTETTNILFTNSKNGNTFKDLTIYYNHYYRFIDTTNSITFLENNNYSFSEKKEYYKTYYLNIDNFDIKTINLSYFKPSRAPDIPLIGPDTELLPSISTETQINVIQMIKPIIFGSNKLKQNVDTALNILNSIIFNLPINDSLDIVFIEETGFNMNDAMALLSNDNKTILINEDNDDLNQQHNFKLNNDYYNIDVILLVNKILHFLFLTFNKNNDNQILFDKSCNNNNKDYLLNKNRQLDNIVVENSTFLTGINVVNKYKGLCLLNKYDSNILSNNVPFEYIAKTDSGNNVRQINLKNDVYHPVFPEEISLGYIHYDNYLSNITLGILEDIGIVVNYNSNYVNNSLKPQDHPEYSDFNNKLLNKTEYNTIYNNLKNIDSPYLSNIKWPTTTFIWFNNDVVEQNNLILNDNVVLLPQFTNITELDKYFTNLENDIRLGLVYHQTLDYDIPFFSNNKERLNDNYENVLDSDLIKYKYFSKELISLTKKYNIDIVDLITCNMPFIEQIDNGPIVNYSINATGNNPLGDWILESNNENISNVYFKDVSNFNEILTTDISSLDFIFERNVYGAKTTYDGNSSNDTWNTNDWKTLNGNEIGVHGTIDDLIIGDASDYFQTNQNWEKDSSNNYDISGSGSKWTIYNHDIPFKGELWDKVWIAYIGVGTPHLKLIFNSPIKLSGLAIGIDKYYTRQPKDASFIIIDSSDNTFQTDASINYVSNSDYPQGTNGTIDYETLNNNSTTWGAIWLMYKFIISYPSTGLIKEIRINLNSNSKQGYAPWISAFVPLVNADTSGGYISEIEHTIQNLLKDETNITSKKSIIKNYAISNNFISTLKKGSNVLNKKDRIRKIFNNDNEIDEIEIDIANYQDLLEAVGDGTITTLSALNNKLKSSSSDEINKMKIINNKKTDASGFIVSPPSGETIGVNDFVWCPLENNDKWKLTYSDTTWVITKSNDKYNVYLLNDYPNTSQYENLDISNISIPLKNSSDVNIFNLIIGTGGTPGGGTSGGGTSGGGTGDPYITTLNGITYKMADFTGFSRMLQGTLQDKPFILNTETTLLTKKELTELMITRNQTLNTNIIKHNSFDKFPAYFSKLHVSWGEEKTTIDLKTFNIIENTTNNTIKKKETTDKEYTWSTNKYKQTKMFISFGPVTLVVKEIPNIDVRNGFTLLGHNYIKNKVGALVKPMYVKDIKLKSLTSTKLIKDIERKHPKKTIIETFYNAHGDKEQKKFAIF